MKTLKLLSVFLVLLIVGCQQESPKVSESEKLATIFLKSQEFASLGVSESDLNPSSIQVGTSRNGVKNITFSTKKSSLTIVGAFFHESGKVGIAYSSEYLSEKVEAGQTLETISSDFENKQFNGRLVINTVIGDVSDKQVLFFKGSELLQPEFARTQSFKCFGDAFYSLGSKNLVDKLWCFATMGSCIAQAYVSCVWDSWF
jgi:hypothetical protein